MGLASLILGPMRGVLCLGGKTRKKLSLPGRGGDDETALGCDWTDRREFRGLGGEDGPAPASDDDLCAGDCVRRADAVGYRILERCGGQRPPGSGPTGKRSDRG